ncbi:hypothetical protein D3C75_900210 [compost metagenome]
MKTEDSFLNRCLENNLHKMRANTTPSTYIARTAVACWAGKNTAANSRYTGSRAEHDMSGIRRVVSMRSLGCSMLRAAIIAGTLQPKPMIKGMNALPLRPIRSIVLSISRQTRAI